MFYVFLGIAKNSAHFITGPNILHAVTHNYKDYYLLGRVMAALCGKTNFIFIRATCSRYAPAVNFSLNYIDLKSNQRYK